jgi:hypothetical protein
MPAVAQPPKPNGLPALVRSLLINLLGPYLVYLVAAPHFAPDSPRPLLFSALLPAADFAIVYLRRRSVDVIALIAFVQISAALAITLASSSASASLGGQALTPAMLGLVFAVSALIGKPLIAPLARQTMAGDDPERQARFDAVALLPGARRVFMRLTLAWAVALGLQTLILLVMVRLLGTADYLLVSQVISFSVLGILIWGSIHFGRRAVRTDPNWSSR